MSNFIGAYAFEFIYGYNYAIKKPKISITYWKSRNYELALTYHSEDDEWDFLAKAFTIS